jgi:hypothetical protein
MVADGEKINPVVAVIEKNGFIYCLLLLCFHIVYGPRQWEWG